MGIAAVGVGVFNLVEHAGEHLEQEVRWPLVAAVGITLISIAFLTRTIQLNEEHQNMLRVAWRVILVSALLIFFLGFTNLETIPLMLAVILLFLAPVYVAFRSWLERLDQVDKSI